MGINSPLIRPHLPRQQGAGQDARHLGGAHLPPIQGREKGARATPCLTRGRRKGAQQSAGHPAWLAALCEASELGVMPAFPSLEHASCVVLWADLMTPPPPSSHQVGQMAGAKAATLEALIQEQVNKK